MARPASDIKLAAGHRTKKEKAIRLDVQDKLAGRPLVLEYPANLTEKQKVIYKWLFDNLSETGFLSALDVESMRNAAIIIDRLNAVDEHINADTSELLDKNICAVRDTYFKQYLNICRELCLSPASRAKIGTLAANNLKDSTDPLLEALAK